MTDRLKLEVLFAGIDKLTKPIDSISASNKNLSKVLKASKEQLKAINNTMGNVDGYQKVNTKLLEQSQRLQDAKDKLNTLTNQYMANGAPTRKMADEIKRASNAVKQLGQEQNNLENALVKERTRLNQVDLAMTNLGHAQDILKLKTYAATGEIKRQEAVLEAANEKAKQLNAARWQYNNSMNTRNKLAGAGAGMVGAGVATGLPVLKMVKDFASFEDAMLGVARQMNGARDANGNLTKTYYEMGDAIQAMSERLPKTANEIAAIVEAGARMGIQGKENLLAYAETTAIMANAFDLPVDEVGDNVATIAALYKVPIKSIQTLGDTINWLDDNTIAKGGDIMDVMKRIAGTADTVKMKYQEAAALGTTFLNLGSAPEIAATATNALITNLSVATMQSNKFKGGLEMLKLSAKDVQLGMSKDATGTILKVLDAIKALPQEKQLEATTRLFGKEFGDDVSKLAANIDQYRNNLKLVNDETARGSMLRENEARSQNLSAQWIMATNNLRNLSADIGSTLKPALIDGINGFVGILKAVSAWTKEHPQLTGAMVKTLAVLAITLTVLGSIALAVAAIIGPMAALKFSMSILEIKGLSLLSPLKLIGNLFLWLGRIAMTNPILLAAFVIAGAAYLIYKNWEPLKKWFGDLFDTIGQKWSALKAMLPEWLGGKPGATISAAGSISKKAAAAGAGVMIGGAAIAGNVPLDTRGPINARPVQVQQQNTNHFTFHAAPGMDEAAMAKKVREEMDKRDRQNAANARSSLRDTH